MFIHKTKKYSLIFAPNLCVALIISFETFFIRLNEKIEISKRPKSWFIFIYVFENVSETLTFSQTFFKYANVFENVFSKTLK